MLRFQVASPAWRPASGWVVLLCAAAVALGSQPRQGAAQSAAAQGTIPLTVTALSGAARNAPVFTGIPFPPGVLQDGERLDLVHRGQSVPRQVTVTSTYPDGSVRVALVGFRATLGSGESQSAEVRYGGGRGTALTPALPWTRSTSVLALCPPRWYGESSVFNLRFLASADNRLFPAFDSRAAQQYESRADPPHITDPNVRGYYDHTHALYMLLLRSGGPTSVPSRIKNEVTLYREREILHSGPYRGQFHAGTKVNHASPMLKDTIRRVYPLGLLEDYYFTGDARSLQVALETGDALLADCYQQLERLTLAERQPGYLIQGLCAMYEATLDRRYLDGARHVATLMMDLQDAMAEKYPNQGGVGGQTGGFIQNGNGQWSDPEESTVSGAGSTWMTGLLCDGLIRLYWLTGDTRVRESIVRAADWLVDAGYVSGNDSRNPSGENAFWYVCRDRNNNTVYPGLNPMLFQLLGFAHQATGDAKYRETARAVLAPNVWGITIKEFNQGMRSSGQGLYLLQPPAGTVPLTLKDAGAARDAGTPDAPAGVTPSGQGSGIQLNWEASGFPGLTCYHVYRGGQRSGPYERRTSSPVALPRWSEGGLNASTTYWYRVTAVGSDGAESIPSGSVAVSPSDGGASSLRGRVESEGRGVAGVVVTFGNRSATTDSEGRYTIQGIAQGAYPLHADKPGYRFDGPPSVSMGAGDATADLAQTTDFLFRDLFAPGWKLSANGAAASASATDPLAEEQRSIAVTITSRGGSVVLGGPGLSVRDRSALRFFLHGGTRGRQDLWVSAFVDGTEQPARRVRTYASAVRGRWVEVSIPLSHLRAERGTLTGIRISGRTPQQQAFLDFVRVQ